VGPEASSIRRAVALLEKSLELAEEGSVHTSEAVTKATDVFGFYRQAFGDSQAPIVEEASAQASEASTSAQAALVSLALARQAIRDFVKNIAPGGRLTEGQGLRSTPTGAKLLETSRRPRNVQEAIDFAIENAEDIASVINDGHDVSHGLIGIFDRPDPSGMVSSAPSQVSGAKTAQNVGGSDGASGDPVLAGIVASVVIVKVVQITASRVRLTARRVWLKITGRN
jgi:hypothetical protein